MSGSRTDTLAQTRHPHLLNFSHNSDNTDEAHSPAPIAGAKSNELHTSFPSQYTLIYTTRARRPSCSLIRVFYFLQNNGQGIVTFFLTSLGGKLGRARNGTVTEMVR
jgi:hypothetical protein